MARTVRIRFRHFLPGAGYDSSGNAKQGKSNIRGSINVSSYTKGGEALAPSDVGLTFIDDLVLTPREGTTSPDPAEGLRQVVYSPSAQQFYVIEGINVPGEVAGGTTLDVTFDAFGDSAHDVELL